MKITALIPVFLLFLFSCTKPKQENSLKSLDNPYYDKAFEFREQDKPDSAFFYFNKAKDFFIAAQDSLGAGKCLVNMAIISTDKGDYFGGQELSLDAMAFLKAQEQAHHVFLKSNLNNLGIAFYNLKNYTRAIEFYEQSLSFSTDSNSILGIKNNIANAYRKQKLHDKALNIYRSILKQPLSPKEYAKVSSNLSYTSWQRNPNFKAAPGLLKALELRKKENDLWGMNSSFAQLSEYYTLKQPDAALGYALKMYGVAKTLNSPDDEIEALQKILKISPQSYSKIYFGRYQQLSDSVQTARSAARNQFAVIRYDAEKAKADNLVLQQENAEKAYQLNIRELLILAGVIGFCMLSVLAALWYRKRKEKMEADKRKAISDSQLITSKRVHDVVANGLYRVIKEIEYGDHINKELILDKLDDMYEKSRDISYDSNPSMEAGEDFHLKINHLLNSFSKPHTQILIQGNTAAYWWGISPKCRNEIEHILQELMVNMDKHSKATMVSTHFQRHADQAQISYSDNGIGIAGALRQQNGLRNTESRIKLINGNITFDNNVDQGLKILISYPLA